MSQAWLNTYAASSLPSITPGTQGLTHKLGIQGKHVNDIQAANYESWLQSTQ